MAGGENRVEIMLGTAVRTNVRTLPNIFRKIARGFGRGRNAVRETVILCRSGLGGADECASPRALFACLLLLGTLVACSKPPAEAPATETPQSTGLESVPEPDPSKYPSIRDMANWQNPYLVVREDGIGFVDLSNHEIHILTPEQVPAELVSLPSSAWPYGRVVMVAQAAPKNPSEQTKADLRKNRALLLGTLKELNVAFREAP
jgi:hypothetical protein